MSDLLPSFSTISQALVVVAAFSALVFVHELGHYLAARFTGVRVERFFIGFDIFGLAIKKEYKGTVYGVGILPLGGYCALAGQNDDPRKERQTGAADELQSKPLWARGLVFSGGVLMNFIFGFLILVATYMYGLPYIPPILGDLTPGGPAQVHGFQTGDRILRVDDRAISSFEDAVEAIALSGAGGEVEVEIERRDASGQSRIETIRVKGRGSNTRGNLNTIGAAPQRSNIVGGVVTDPLFADRLAGKLEIGDQILAVNGHEIADDAGVRILDLLEKYPGEEALLSVKSARDGITREVSVPLETYGDWDIGLRIGINIMGVMPDGPAAKAGLRQGDVVVAYQLPDEDQPRRIVNIRDFQATLAEMALRPVEVTLDRQGEQLTFRVSPRPLPGNSEFDFDSDTLLGVQGVMQGDAGFQVEKVLPGSPLTDLAQPGDLLVGIGGSPLPKGKSLREMVEEAASADIRLFVYRKPGQDEIAAPYRSDIPDANLALRLSPRINPEYRRPMIGIDLASGPVVTVEPGSFADTSLGGGKRLIGARPLSMYFSPDLATVLLQFVFPDDSPYSGLKKIMVQTPDSIRLDPLGMGLLSRLPADLKTVEEVKPLSFGPAVVMAGKKWVDLAGMVYRVLHKLVVRTLPLDAVGGPVQLFRIIKSADERGFAYFMYIVALISINLGVCNLLPFPVLDGGHIVFLLIEWLMGRPPSPAVKETAHYIGLACLLMLMLTVTGYDLMYLFRGN